MILGGSSRPCPREMPGCPRSAPVPSPGRARRRPSGAPRPRLAFPRASRRWRCWITPGRYVWRCWWLRGPQATPLRAPAPPPPPAVPVGSPRAAAGRCRVVSRRLKGAPPLRRAGSSWPLAVGRPLAVCVPPLPSLASGSPGPSASCGWFSGAVAETAPACRC